MGFLAQLGITLKKNFNLRRRQPIIVLFELVWPLVVFLIVLAVRQQMKPDSKPNCAYKSHAMTSAGMIPFVQSFVCSMNSDCIKNITDDTPLPTYAEAQIGPLMTSTEKLMNNDNLTDMMDKMPHSINLINVIIEALQKPEVKDFLVNGIKFEELLADPSDFKDYLSRRLGILPVDVVDDLLGATLNIPKLFELIGYSDLKGVVCNAIELGKYITTSKDSNLTVISKALCEVNSSMISDIVNQVQQHLTLTKIVHKVMNLIDIIGDDTFSNAIKDISNMIQVAFNLTEDQILINMVPKLVEISHWLIDTVNLIKTIQTFKIDFTFLEKILKDLKPLLGNSPLIEQIMAGLEHGIFIMNQITRSIYHEAGSNLTFGQLFLDDNFIRDFMTDTLKIPVDIVSQILNTTIDFRKFQAVFEFPKPSNIHSLLCDIPGIAGLFQDMTNGSNFSIGHILQEKICENDPTTVYENFQHAFDLELIELEKNYPNLTNINWLEVINMTLETFQSLSREYGDFSFQLGPYATSISSLAKLLLENNSTHYTEIYTAIIPAIIPIFQSSLPKQFRKSLDNIIAFLNINVDILKQLFNNVFIGLQETDLQFFFTESLFNHLKKIVDTYPEFIHDIIALDPFVIKFLIKPFSNPSKIKMVMEDINVRQLYCTEANIEKICGELPVNVSWRLITTKLCSEAFQNLAQELLNDYYIITSKFSQLEVMRINPKRKSSAGQDIFSLVVKIQDLVNEIYNNRPKFWDGDILLAKLSEKDREKLNDLRTIFYSYLDNKFSTLQRFTMVSYGQLFEQYSFWKYIKGPMRTVYDTAEKIAQIYDTVVGFFVKVTAKDGFIDKIASVISSLPQIIDLTLDDPVKLLKLTRVTDWYSILCSSGNLNDYFIIPPEYLQNFTNNVQEICHDKTLHDIWDKFKKIILPKANKNIDDFNENFDWDGLFNSVYAIINNINKGLFDIDWKVLNRIEPHYLKFMESVHEMRPHALNWILFGVLNMLENVDQHVSEPFKIISKVTDLLLEFLNEKLRILLDFGLKTTDIFVNAPELTKIVKEGVILLPNLSTAFVNILYNPQKLLSLINTLIITPSRYCQDIYLTEMLVPKDEKLIAWELSICQKQVEIENEFFEQKEFSEIRKLMNRNNKDDPVTLDWKLFLTKIKLFITQFNMALTKPENLFTDVPEFNTETVCEAFQTAFREPFGIYELIRYLLSTLDASLFVENLSCRDCSTRPQPKGQTILNPGCRECSQRLKFIPLLWIIALEDTITDFLKEIKGKSVNLTEILKSPELDKIYKYMEKAPEFTKMHLNAYLIPNRASVFYDNQGFKLCRDPDYDIGIIKNLTDSGVNHEELQKILCDFILLDWKKLLHDISQNNRGLKAIENLLFNSTQNVFFQTANLFDSSVNLVAAFQDVLRFPPHININLNSTFLHDSSWIYNLIIFTDLGTWLEGYLANTFMAFEAAYYKNQGWIGFKSYVKSLTILMKYVNDKIGAGQIISLASLIPPSTQLGSIIEDAVEVIPDINEALIFSIFDFKRMFLYSDQHWEDRIFCKNFSITDILEFQNSTSKIKVKALEKKICQTKIKDLSDDFLRITGLNEIQNTGRNQSLNWPDVMNISHQFIRNLDALHLSNFSCFLDRHCDFIPIRKEREESYLSAFLGLIDYRFESLLNCSEESCDHQSYIYLLGQLRHVAVFLNRVLYSMSGSIKQFKEFNGGLNEFLNLNVNKQLNKIVRVIKKSPAIVENLLRLSTNSPEAQLFSNELAKNPLNQAWVCNNETGLIQFLQDSTVITASKYEVKQLICNLFTVQGNKLLTELKTLLPATRPLIEMFQKPSVYTQKFVLRDSYNNITYIIMSLDIDFYRKLNLNDTFLKEKVWINVLKTFWPVYRNFSIFSWKDTVYRLIPAVHSFMNSIGAQNFLNVLNTLLHTIDTKLKTFEGQKIDLPMLFEGYPETQKLIIIAKTKLPEIIKIFLYNSFIVPEKPDKFLSAMKTWDHFCSSNITDVFDLPKNTTIDIVELQNRFCEINIQTLQSEIKQLAPTWNDNPNEVSQETILSLINTIFNITEDIETLSKKNVELDLPWVNNEAWAEIEHILQDLSNYWLSPDIWQKLLHSLSPTFKEVTSRLQLNSFLQYLSSYYSWVFSLFKNYDGTSINFAVLFKDYPNLSQLSEVIEKNFFDFIDIFITTYFQKPAEMLNLLEKRPQDAWKFVCKLKDPNSYFKQTSVKNLAILQKDLCHVNISRLTSEFSKFINVDELQKMESHLIDQNAEPVELDSLGNIILNYTRLVLQLSKAKFETSIFDNWDHFWNSTIYSQVINPSSWMSIISKNLLNSYLSSVDKYDLTLTNSIVELTNVLLSFLQNGAEGVAGKLIDQKIFDLINYMPEIFESVMATLLSKDKVNQIVNDLFPSTNSPQFEYLFCKNPGLKNYFVVPKSSVFDPALLQDAICDSEKFRRNYKFISLESLNNLIEVSNDLPPINSSDVIQSIAELQTTLQSFYLPPHTPNPQVNLTGFRYWKSEGWNIAMGRLRNFMMFQKPEEQSTVFTFISLLGPVLDSFYKNIISSGDFTIIKSATRLFHMFVSFYKETLEDSNGNLDEIFSDREKFSSYFKKCLIVFSKFSEEVFLDTLNPYIEYITNNGNALVKLCSQIKNQDFIEKDLCHIPVAEWYNHLKSLSNSQKNLLERYEKWSLGVLIFDENGYLLEAIKDRNREIAVNSRQLKDIAASIVQLSYYSIYEGLRTNFTHYEALPLEEYIMDYWHNHFRDYKKSSVKWTVLIDNINDITRLATHLKQNRTYSPVSRILLRISENIPEFISWQFTELYAIYSISQSFLFSHTQVMQNFIKYVNIILDDKSESKVESFIKRLFQKGSIQEIIVYKTNLITYMFNLTAESIEEVLCKNNYHFQIPTAIFTFINPVICERAKEKDLIIFQAIKDLEIDWLFTKVDLPENITASVSMLRDSIWELINKIKQFLKSIEHGNYFTKILKNELNNNDVILELISSGGFLVDSGGFWKGEEAFNAQLIMQYFDYIFAKLKAFGDDAKILQISTDPNVMKEFLLQIIDFYRYIFDTEDRLLIDNIFDDVIWDNSSFTEYCTKNFNPQMFYYKRHKNLQQLLCSKQSQDVWINIIKEKPFLYFSNNILFDAKQLPINKSHFFRTKVSYNHYKHSYDSLIVQESKTFRDEAKIDWKAVGRNVVFLKSFFIDNTLFWKQLSDTFNHHNYNIAIKMPFYIFSWIQVGSLSSFEQRSPAWTYSFPQIKGMKHSLNFINQLFDQLLGNNFLITSLLPSSKDIFKLFDKIMDSKVQTELQITLLNPRMMLPLYLNNSYESEFCSGRLFNQSWNVHKNRNYQTDLCEMAKNKTLFIPQLIEMYNLTELVQTIYYFSVNKLDNIEPVDWKNFLISYWNSWDKFETIMSNFPKLFEKIPDWFLGIIKMIPDIYTDKQSLITMCQATTDESQSSSMLHIQKFINDQLDKFDDYMEILCDFPKLSLAELHDRLVTDLNIFNSIQKILEEKDDNGFNCSIYAQQYIDYQTKLESLIHNLTNDGIYKKRIGQCLINLKDSKMIKELDIYLDIFSQIMNVARETTNQNLLADYVPYIKEIVDVLKKHIPVFIPVREIISTDKLVKELEGYFPNLQYFKELLDSSIDINLINRLNGSLPRLKYIVCNSSYFDHVVHSKTSEKVNMSKWFCQGNILEIVQILSTQSKEIVPELSERQTKELMKFDWLLTIIKDIEILSTEMIGILHDLNYDQNSQIMTSSSDLYKILTDESLIESIDRMLPLLKDILNVFSDCPYVRYIKAFVNGILGLRTLQQQGLLALKYNIGQLFHNVSDIKDFFISTLQLSPEIVDSLFNVSIDLASIFMAAKDLQNPKVVLCDPQKLGKLLVLNSSKHLEELSDTICQLSKEKIEDLTVKLIQNLNVGHFVEQFVELGMTGLLSQANMTMDEAKVAVENLHEIQSALSDILDQFLHISQTFPEIEEFSNNTQEPENAFPVSNALHAVGKVMCGKPLTFMDDRFNLISNEDVSQKSVRHKRDVSDDDSESEDFESPFCQKMQRQIIASKGGLIVWTYLKPLLKGKILFTPITESSLKIIKEAQPVFEQVENVINKIRKLINGLSSMDALQINSETLAILQELQENSFLTNSMTGIFNGNIQHLLDSLGYESWHNIQSIIKLMKLISNLTECIDFQDRFVGVSSEKELEALSKDLSVTNMMFAGIVFLNLENSTSTLPAHIKYKIRMDIDNVPPTDSKKEQFWRPNAYDSVAEHMRYLRGFIQLQDIIDRAIINIQVGHQVEYPGVYLKKFPYPCHKNDIFGYYMQHSLPLLTTLAWIFTIGLMIRSLVYDREKKLELVMHVMGMHRSVSWLAWFISSFTVMLIIVIMLIIILNVGGILKYSDAGILFLFFIDYAFSLVMFCYLISVFFKSTSLAGLFGIIFYLISYLPFIIIISLEAQTSYSEKLVYCLLSATAFSFGSMKISHWEAQGIGVQWSNIDSSPVAGDPSLALICVMIFIDSLIYFILAWYFQNVLPGPDRIQQPWYFVFSPHYWGWKKTCYNSYDVPHAFLNRASDEKCNLIEKVDSKMVVGISLCHLNKFYKNKFKAIDDLTVNFFDGQITSLLGHNGAGKTTTINMLTGMDKPTSGAAYIYGRDVSKDFDKDKNMIGVCPQHDILFELLSVREHLVFYAKMKTNKSDKEIKEDVDKTLDSMNLWDIQCELACTLSGGMKRRLSVAIAFIGGSKLIILDEPTSGVDPVARRQIWDLIVANKEGRTILLTTHHLDEADILSDRIAIIHQGKLLCCGSSLFLKNHIGNGYRMTLSKNSNKNEILKSDDDITVIDDKDNRVLGEHSHIMAFIHSEIEGAELVEVLGDEMTVSLPNPGDNTKNYADFFRKLDKQKETLGISNFGISNTSLEEVFLRLCKQAEACMPIIPDNLKQPLMEDVEDNLSSVDSEEDMTDMKTAFILPTTGACLKLQQFKALMTKRFHHHRRNWKSILSSIILPCIFVIVAMAFTLLRSKMVVTPSILLTPNMYGPYDHTFFSLDRNDLFSRQLESALISDPGIGTTCMNSADKSDSSICIPASSDFTNNYTSFLTSRKTLPVCKCDDVSQYCHAPNHDNTPPRMLTRSSDFLYNLTNVDISEYLLSTYFDFIDKRYGGWTFGVKQSEIPNSVLGPETDNNVVVWFNNEGFHAMPAFYNSLSNLILRSFMKKEYRSPAQYGISVYNHPLKLTQSQLSVESLMQHVADLGIALVIVIAFCLIPAGFTLYLVNERINKEKRLQYINGVGPTLYWFTALIWDMLYYMLAVALAAIIIFAFGFNMFTDRQNLAAIVALLTLFGWATIPTMYVMSRLFRDSSMAYVVAVCINIFISVNTLVADMLLLIFSQKMEIKAIYQILNYVFMLFPQYNLGGGLLKLIQNQLKTEVMARFGEDAYKNPFGMDVLGWHLVAMAVLGLIFFIITLIIEHRCVNKRKPMCSPISAEDNDVAHERKRVLSCDTDIIKVFNLTKFYRNILGKNMAVSQIQFGVSKGECFGLLGANGAGKTTTFKMLCGDLMPSSGDIHLNDNSIVQDFNSINGDIGYCPQKDALDNYLSARELLTVYAYLRGINKININKTVGSCLTKFKMLPFADQRIGTYSGGMKRKLSTALSLLGNPQIILMDEPTSGMDPQTRSLVWQNIKKILKDNRSVILTSHSMAECDSLCTRMAIMVNGQFKCLGSPQHLKNKFGNGYTVTIRAGSLSDLLTMKAYLQHYFPFGEIKAQHNQTLEFALPSKGYTLSDIFDLFDVLKNIVDVVDYSITQTTLDQVFINFSREQSDGLKPATSDETFIYNNILKEGKDSNSQYYNNTVFSNIDSPKSFNEEDYHVLENINICDFSQKINFDSK